MKKTFTILATLIFVANTFAQLWVPTTDFSCPKNSQTINKLDDGRVIQIGGDRGFNAYSRAVEIYDPNTNIWTTVDSLPYSLRYHSSFLLENNKVLVMGGTSESVSTNGVLEYDVEADSWAIKANMPEALENLSAQKLIDGRIFVCGGWVFETAAVNQDAYIYTPSNDSWETVTQMPVGLVNSVCEMISDDEVLIVGGVKADFSTSPKSYVYEISTDNWTIKSDLPFSISGGMASVVLNDGNVLAAGGFDFGSFSYWDKVLVYDTELGEWSELSSIDEGLSSMSLVNLTDGTSLLAGGNSGGKSNENKEYSIANFNGLFASNLKTPSALAYLVDAEGLNPIEDLPRATTGAMSVLLNNKDVLLSGGSGVAMASDTYSNGLIYNNPVTVGLNKDIQNSFSINPNPASTHIAISIIDPSVHNVSIFSIEGRELINQEINSLKVNIDISSLSRGVYIIKIDNNTFAQKLIVR